MKKIFFICLLLANVKLATAQKISKDNAEKIASAYLNTAIESYKKQAAPDWNSKVIHQDNLAMKFDYQIFGNAAFGTRSLYISLHGGGNAAPAVNDQQWENQKKLYTPAEGVYLAPRAPTNTWNLWHEQPIDDLFATIIKDAIVFEGVDPNKVYLLGYSAGGDGLYQLAPRMAGHWAAAAMMAGHPGDASALPLRNLPFAIFMGGKDGAYDRNKHAATWAKKLDSLQAADPQGYQHIVHIYEDLGHWMLRKDTIAISWMASFSRNALPKKVIWVQDDRLHDDFYWLGTNLETTKAGDEAIVSVEENQITIAKNTFKTLSIFLNDGLVDLNKPVKVFSGGKEIFSGKLKRKENIIKQSIDKRLDQHTIFFSEIKIENNKATAVR
ncbi:MAG: hypothetical protein ACOH2A_11455 [Sphingobacteriaceae bacterium]